MDPQDKSQAKMKWPLEATDVNDKKGRMEQKLQQTAWRCILLREPFLTDGDIYIDISIFWAPGTSLMSTGCPPPLRIQSIALRKSGKNLNSLIPLNRGNPPARALPVSHTLTQKARAHARTHTYTYSVVLSFISLLASVGNYRKHRTSACWARRRRCLVCPPSCSLSRSPSLSLNQRGYCHHSQELPFRALMPKRTGGVSAKGSF